MAILAYDDVMLREPRLLVPCAQPIGNVRLDAAHPLVGGMVGCWLFSQSVNTLLPQGGFGVSTLTGDAKVSCGRLVLDATGDYLTTAASPIVTAPLSIGAVVHACTDEGPVAMLGGVSVTNWDGWYLYTAPDGVTTWNSVNNNTFNGIVTLPSATRWPFSVCGSATTTRLSGALNGVAGTPDTSFTDPGTLGSNPRLRIGAVAKLAVDNLIGAEIPFVCVWNRALADVELVAWTADPYQIFVPA